VEMGLKDPNLKRGRRSPLQQLKLNRVQVDIQQFLSALKEQSSTKFYWYSTVGSGEQSAKTSSTVSSRTHSHHSKLSSASMTRNGNREKSKIRKVNKEKQQQVV